MWSKHTKTRLHIWWCQLLLLYIDPGSRLRFKHLVHCWVHEWRQQEATVTITQPLTCLFSPWLLHILNLLSHNIWLTPSHNVCRKLLAQTRWSNLLPCGTKTLFSTEVFVERCGRVHVCHVLLYLVSVVSIVPLWAQVKSIICHFGSKCNCLTSMWLCPQTGPPLWHITGPAAALTLGMGSGVQWRGGGGTGHHGLLGAHAGPGGWRRQTEKPPRKASNQSALIHRRQHREPVRTEGGVGAELGAWPEAAVCQLGRVTTSCRDRKMTNYY